MKRFATVALLAVLVFGCSSSDDSAEESGPCQQRSGSYIAKYTVRSGTCGDGAETVLNIDQQPTEVSAPCTGSISYTTDNCEVTYSSSCPAEEIAPGAQLSITGKSKWSRDAASGSATEAWVVKDANGQVACQGTYDVTISRQ